MNKDEVARYLTDIADQEYLDILQAVFATRVPWPLEFTENRY